MREDGNVSGKMLGVGELTPRQREQMCLLMREYFTGVDPDKFARDLDEKEWVVLLEDAAAGKVVGFTALCMMDAVVDGETVRVFYSGDTIVAQSVRRRFSLEKNLVPLIFSHVLQNPEFKWYWFLVCKGYRTYRYLPVHFRQYWPRPDATMPEFERRLLAILAKKRFGDCYDERTGLVRCPVDYCLKPGVGDVTDSRLGKPEVAFFVAKNPQWQTGAELCCLARLALDNLRPPLFRFVAKSLDPAR